MHWTSLFLLLTLANAQAMVVGKDDRVEVSVEDESPYDKVVNVWRPDGSSCTGAFVGDDLVLTAAHCIVLDGLPDPTSVRIRTAYKNGASEMQSAVSDATYPAMYIEKGERKDDWAILKLTTPLGENYGHYEVVSSMHLQDFHDLVLPGYNVDLFKGEVLTADPKCSLTSITTSGVIFRTFDNMFFHDCDTSEGSSGAPVLNCHFPDKKGCVIMGLNRGRSSFYWLGTSAHHLYKSWDNDAVHPKAFISALKELLR